MKNFWQSFPSKENLSGKARTAGQVPVNVNAHLHTPWSFSAFDSIPQALDLAKKEGVCVAGINDFYTTQGYSEWAQECISKNIFPLFNIELISLNKADQEAGIRVNDPNNPGRTYLSGKGLTFPQSLKEPYLSLLNNLREESNQHARRMCSRLNELLVAVEAPFTISYNDIQSKLTRGNVRERHIAKYLREMVTQYFQTPALQAAFWEKIFGGKPLKSPLENFAAIENEVRGNLLKAGGAAFVPEDPKAFLEMNKVCDFILNAGGIPTYPFLADDASGKFTDFEEDKEKVAEILKERGIWSVEFITTRNSQEVLEEYAGYFYHQGFIVTFGTEHNTPAMEPVLLHSRGGNLLSNLLIDINYKGACVIAAHQYLYATEGKGYLDSYGKPGALSRSSFEELGNALIHHIIR